MVAIAASGVAHAAEDDTDDGLDIGGYAGLGVRYGRVIERDTALLCAEAAIFFDSTFSAGPGGCSTFLSADASTENVEAERLEISFAATTFRYHFMVDSPYNVSLGLTAGAGSIELVSGIDEVERTDSLIVVEPEVGAHTLATDWMRLSLVGAYRFVSGVDTGGVTSSDVSGFSVGVNAHVGWL